MKQKSIYRPIKLLGAMITGWFALVGISGLMTTVRPALAAPPDDGKQVPFQGTFTGFAERQALSGGGPTESDWSGVVDAVGEATHLGKVRAVLSSSHIHLAGPTTLVVPEDSVQSFEFTGANGDKIFGHYDLTIRLSSTFGVLDLGDTFVIDGGEGRF